MSKILKNKSFDKLFLYIVIILTVCGFLLFLSASLGLLAREGASFKLVAVKQLIVIAIGWLAFFITSRIPYKVLRKYSLYIYALSFILTLMVFIPIFGFSHGGASRWLSLGSFSFQPSEFLKAGFVIYFAAWLSSPKRKRKSLIAGVLPTLVIITMVGAILIFQPNTSTFVVIFLTAISMMIISGERVAHIAIILFLVLLGFIMLVSFRPYIKDRVLTFLHPAENSQTTGYQIQQSLIAIGSGGWLGRGFGQSAQKFNFLPEAVGDSIFAVTAEEFGFVGSLWIIALFLGFAWRGFSISLRSPDNFSGLLTAGFVILIVSESFINISSMLGIIPLTGVPLHFISHGGSAMLFSLSEAGVIYGISKFAKN